MINRRNSYFMLLIITSLLYSCKPTPEIKEKEIYSLINELVIDDTLFFDNVCCEFSELSLDEDELKEFTSEDIEFNENLQSKFKHLKVKPNSIIHFHRVNNPPTFASVDKTCDKNSVVHLSLPFISIDRKKLLIKIDNDCNCMLGGSGGKYLFEKVNGKWKLKKSFDVWIS